MLILAALFAPTASASSCDSVTSCTQSVRCTNGMTLSTHAPVPYAFFCSQTTGPQPVAPVCSEHNGHSDWQWDSAQAKCKRTRPNGVEVATTANVTCPTGSSPIAPNVVGACRTNGGTTWAAPSLSRPGSVVRASPLAPNQAAATRRLICDVGVMKQTGGNYFCELHVPNNRTEEPTCAKTGNLVWTWDAAAKACKRTANRQTFTNTNNITCKAGATYNAQVGRCHTPAGTTYSSPRMVSL